MPGFRFDPHSIGPRPISHGKIEAKAQNAASVAPGRHLNKAVAIGLSRCDEEAALSLGRQRLDPCEVGFKVPLFSTGCNGGPGRPVGRTHAPQRQNGEKEKSEKIKKLRNHGALSVGRSRRQRKRVQFAVRTVHFAL